MEVGPGSWSHASPQFLPTDPSTALPPPQRSRLCWLCSWGCLGPRSWRSCPLPASPFLGFTTELPASHSVDQQTLSRMIIETNLLATVAQARYLQRLDQHTRQAGDSEDSMGSEAWMRERNSSFVSPSPSSSSLDQAPSKMIASTIYEKLTKRQTSTQPSHINSVGPHHFGGYLRCRGFQLHALGHPARK